MTRTRHVPQRSCVACRQVRPKTELLRVVRTPLGAVRVDGSGKLAGRGAYLCPTEACAAQAVKQKRLGRALGVAVGPEVTEEITSWLAAGRPAEGPGSKPSDT
jgi:predicted RNA-binding protein YlxR (DUF448 family)